MATATVDAVELGFCVHIRDPDTGEVLDEQLVGSLDLVLRADDRRVIVEHKSAARRYSADQLRNEIQLTAYQLAVRQLGFGSVDLVYQVITKTKIPPVQVERVMRSRADEIDLLRIVVGVLRAIDAGIYFPTRGPHCRTCPYQQQCTAARDARAHVLQP